MARAGLSAEAVVNAAAQLADADGLEELTLARVAQHLGVRSPSLYAHVGGGLADLRARLALRGVRLLSERLLHAIAGRTGAEALRGAAEAYRDFGRDHPGLYAATQGELVSADPEVAGAAGELVEILTAVLRGYGLEGEDAVHGVRLLRAAVHGFVDIERQGGFAMDVSLDVTWERLIAMLDGGLAPGA